MEGQPESKAEGMRTQLVSFYYNPTWSELDMGGAVRVTMLFTAPPS